MTNPTPGETPSDTGSSLDRRAWMTRAALGGAAVLGGALAGGTVAQARGPDISVRKERLVIDVACLGDTYREQLTEVQAEGDVVDPTDHRGSTFAVEGWIYPGEFIEASGFIPTEEDSIGRWFCSGFNIFGPERPEPHGNASANFVFGSITEAQPFPADTLVTTGLGSAPKLPDEPSHLPILGGSGRFVGAIGQANRVTTSRNTSIFFGTDDLQSPNFRYEFDLMFITG